MIRSFLQAGGLLLTAEAAWMLTKSTHDLTTEVVVKLSTPRWEYQLEVARSLCRQRAEARVGTILLMMALLAQTANGVWPIRWVDLW